MKCVDHQRHEKGLECRHRDHHFRYWWRTVDGCDGDACWSCFFLLGINNWPDLVEVEEAEEHERTVLRELLLQVLLEERAETIADEIGIREAWEKEQNRR